MPNQNKNQKVFFYLHSGKQRYSRLSLMMEDPFRYPTKTSDMKRPQFKHGLLPDSSAEFWPWEPTNKQGSFSTAAHVTALNETFSALAQFVTEAPRMSQEGRELFRQLP